MVMVALLTLVAFNSFAQEPYTLKETFDKLYPHYSTGDNALSLSAPAWFKKWGWNLFALSAQWETTGDKDYAFKFIKNAYTLLEFRDGLTWDAISSDPNDEVHYTGELMDPMARFTYLVQSNIEFSETELPSGLVPSLIDDQAIVTAGDFAGWMADQLKSAYDYYTYHYWQAYHNYLSKGILGVAYEMNYQSHYFQIGSYLYSMGLCSYCQDKVEGISNFFHDNMTIYSPNGSVTWFHNSRWAGDDAVGSTIFR